METKGGIWVAPHTPHLLSPPSYLTLLAGAFEKSAAARSHTVVPGVHPGVEEFRLAHYPIARVNCAHVRQIALIIGHSGHGAEDRATTCEETPNELDHRPGAPLGR